MVKEIEDLTEKNKGTEEISDIGGKEEIRNDLNANTSEAVSNHDIMCTNASKSNLNRTVTKYTTSDSSSELVPNDVVIPDPLTDMAEDVIFPTRNEIDLLSLSDPSTSPPTSNSTSSKSSSLTPSQNEIDVLSSTGPSLSTTTSKSTDLFSSSISSSNTTLRPVPEGTVILLSSTDEINMTNESSSTSSIIYHTSSTTSVTSMDSNHPIKSLGC